MTKKKYDELQKRITDLEKSIDSFIAHRKKQLEYFDALIEASPSMKKLNNDDDILELVDVKDKKSKPKRKLGRPKGSKNKRIKRRN